MAHGVGSVACPKIRRGQHDVRSLLGGQRGEPAPKGRSLLLSELAKRNVDVASQDVDQSRPSSVRRIAGDVARAFSVPDDPKSTRPVLRHMPPNYARLAEYVTSASMRRCLERFGEAAYPRPGPGQLSASKSRTTIIVLPRP